MIHKAQSNSLYVGKCYYSMLPKEDKVGLFMLK